MIFIASYVPSLSQLLHRWEIGEYVSEAFVILACAGEMVADLGTDWLGARRKKRVERLSTVLLVAALSISLICLVRTNELSGVAIGSLGEKSEDADRKAKAAISDASTAQTLANDALAKAHEAEEYATPRTVSKKQAALIRERIRSLKGHKLIIFANPHDTEIAGFASRILVVCGTGIMDVTVGVWPTGWISPPGMKFEYGKDRKQDFDSLVAALDEAGVEKADVLRRRASMKGIPDDQLDIVFGPKH